MAVNNYTYFTGSLWGLNMKCASQKAFKQTHCTNTDDHCNCRWGKELRKIKWLAQGHTVGNARTVGRVFPLNHRSKGISWTPHPLPTLPYPTPRDAHSCQEAAPEGRRIMIPHHQRRPPSSVKAHDAALGVWDGMPRSTMSPAPAPRWAHGDKELRWRHGWPGSGVACGGMEEAAGHGAVSQARGAQDGGLLGPKADTEDSRHEQHSNPTFRGSFAFPVRDL